MAEDYILKQVILKLFVTLNSEFYLGEHLLRVPNRALKFKIPKTPRKQGKVLISLTNQR